MRLLNAIQRNIANTILLRQFVKGQKCVLCAGIRKSGNTYLWFLLANYIALKEGFTDSPLSYQMMMGILPSSWGERKIGQEDQLIQIGSPILNLAPYGFTNFVRTHRPFTPDLNIFSRILHIHRNPLDFTVSIWHYRYLNRPNIPDITARQCLEKHLVPFIEKYRSYRDNKNALHLDYETLIKQPLNTFRSVLQYISPAHEIDEAILQKAVEFSDKDVISRMEKTHGSIHAPKDFQGSFVRDASIGQWKQHFNDDDIAFCKRTLAAHNVDWSEFIFEQRIES